MMGLRGGFRDIFFIKVFLFYLLPVFTLLVLARCSKSSGGAGHLSEEQRKQIHSAVINRFNAMIKYSEAGELENMLMHFDGSRPGTYIVNGTPYPSLEDMMDHYRATWRIQKQDYGIPVTQVFVLSPDFALVTSSASLNTTNRGGITFQPRPWSVSTLWTFKEDEWLIHSFHQHAGDLKPVEQDEVKQ